MIGVRAAKINIALDSGIGTVDVAIQSRLKRYEIQRWEIP